VVTALFSLFSVRTSVIMPVENVLARVESVFDNAARDILSTVERYTTTPYVVR